ncbi:zinc finger protein 667-like [Elysia marginata]|uniref:Zinc finger protein 667-like n=1 Tax=Elysia marginata TaxID=1093978 RepID=A0AAV4J0F4_9GAST|nr:zinc finger protein 667-like [Elysia marginata]
MDSFLCGVCSSPFECYLTFLKHKIKDQHGDLTQCPLCWEGFSQGEDLTTHLKFYHLVNLELISVLAASGRIPSPPAVHTRNAKIDIVAYRTEKALATDLVVSETAIGSTLDKTVEDPDAGSVKCVSHEQKKYNNKPLLDLKEKFKPNISKLPFYQREAQRPSSSNRSLLCQKESQRPSSCDLNVSYELNSTNRDCEIRRVSCLSSYKLPSSKTAGKYHLPKASHQLLAQNGNLNGTTTVPAIIKRETYKSAKLAYQDIPGQYPCTTCGKVFTRLRYLRKHQVVHKVERPHLCDVCGKCFKTLGALNIHRRSESAAAKPKDKTSYIYKCPQCGFTSRDRKATHKHLQLHPCGASLCQVCGLRYNDQFALKKHAKVHDLSRPFACSHLGCTWRFKTKAKCEVHEQGYMHKLPKFQCHLCGSKFHRKHSLKPHIDKCHKNSTVIKTLSSSVVSSPIQSSPILSTAQSIQSPKETFLSTQNDQETSFISLDKSLPQQAMSLTSLQDSLSVEYIRF